MLVVGNRLTVVVDTSPVKRSTFVTDSLLAVVTDKPSAAVAEPQAVAVGLLTTIAEKPSAAEPMHNIDNRLSESMFDADEPSAVRCDNQTDEQIYQHPHV